MRNCGDVVNAFMQIKSKKGAFLNSVDSDEPQSCDICHVKHILSNGGDIKSYMN